MKNEGNMILLGDIDKVREIRRIYTWMNSFVFFFYIKKDLRSLTIINQFVKKNNYFFKKKKK